MGYRLFKAFILVLELLVSDLGEFGLGSGGFKLCLKQHYFVWWVLFFSDSAHSVGFFLFQRFFYSFKLLFQGLVLWSKFGQLGFISVEIVQDCLLIIDQSKSFLFFFLISLDKSVVLGLLFFKLRFDHRVFHFEDFDFSFKFFDLFLELKFLLLGLSKLFSDLKVLFTQTLDSVALWRTGFWVCHSFYWFR